MAKLVYFSREAHSTEPGGRLNFQSFETDRIDDCIEYMRHLKDKQLALNGSKPGELCVMATGGGSYKFYDQIKERLGVDVLREDEMECLIIGEFYCSFAPKGFRIRFRILTRPCRNRPGFFYHRDTPRGLYVF